MVDVSWVETWHLGVPSLGGPLSGVLNGFHGGVYPPPIWLLHDHRKDEPVLLAGCPRTCGSKFGSAAARMKTEHDFQFWKLQRMALPPPSHNDCHLWSAESHSELQYYLSGQLENGRLIHCSL